MDKNNSVDNEMSKAEKLEKEILGSDDYEYLYLKQIEAAKEIANIHEQIATSETEMDRTELKGDLKVYYTLQEVCQKRIEDLRDANARLNHRFRVAAKSILPKHLYEKVFRIAKAG